MSTAAEDRATGSATDQSEIIAFLSSPAAFGLAGEPALRLDTHGAHVFAAGDIAFKIKRAVRFHYLDFSTLEKRRQALLRELEINRAHAPEIYIGVMPITRAADGRLRFDGDGEIVEWTLRMRRFEQSELLSAIASRGLAEGLLKQLADVVHRSHAVAPVVRMTDPCARLASIAEEVRGALAATWPDDARWLHDRVLALLDGSAAIIERRAQAGFVRRCHGDLHLANIVLWRGRPTLFDALEFDEDLATIDTLYDLSFLLMDLEARASRAAANLVLNRYLWRSNATLDLEGVAALPVFLALRAGIRAMTTQQRAASQAAEEAVATTREAHRYLDLAQCYATPRRPTLVAVGGLSGTGKTTLAAALAPLLGPSPGALHLRSDLERKALAGVDELDRLPASAYGQPQNKRVYDVLVEKSSLALGAHHAVVTDAVYADGEERAAIEAVATRAGVEFAGVWLEASAELIMARVEQRRGDASDATADVVAAQLERGTGEHGWIVVDACGTAAATLANAIAALRQRIPDAIAPEELQRGPR